jgi:fluoride exporter
VTALLVVLGAAVGAPARYLLDRMVQARHESSFPWGTWVVNVTGSFLLGLLVAGVAAGDLGTGAMAGVGVGFCGALTTYSTFGYETVRLLESGAWRKALGNVGLSVIAGLGAAVAGLSLGSWAW